MCGLAGVLIGDKPNRSKHEMKAIGRIFTNVLMLSERRGPRATGVAWVSDNGEYCVSKAPTPAGKFVVSKSYKTVLAKLDESTTLLMGHTRWPTRGSHLNNANNHPLVSSTRGGACILSHNGHIANANVLFHAMGLPRTAQVDSEILLRIAERNLGNDGIDHDGLAADLAYCRGRMSFVVTATTRPTEVILVKGNQPLELWYSQRHHVLLYASESEFLDEALEGEDGWVEWQIPPMRIAIFRTDSLDKPIIRPFYFEDGASRAIYDFRTDRCGSACNNDPLDDVIDTQD